MKLVFIDLEGVLMPIKNDRARLYGIPLFIPNSVCWLNKILQESNSQLVVVSMWCNNFNNTFLHNLLEVRGVDMTRVKECIAIPQFTIKNNIAPIKVMKGQIIKEYLESVDKKVKKWIYIDGINEALLEQRKHFILTKKELGVREATYNKALKILL